MHIGSTGISLRIQEYFCFVLVWGFFLPMQLNGRHLLTVLAVHGPAWPQSTPNSGSLLYWQADQIWAFSPYIVIKISKGPIIGCPKGYPEWSSCGVNCVPKLSGKTKLNSLNLSSIYNGESFKVVYIDVMTDVSLGLDLWTKEDASMNKSILKFFNRN